MAFDENHHRELLRILMIGEVYGRPGRKVLAALLPKLKKEYKLDLIIVNGESAAGGFGLTIGTVEELLDNGVDVLTSGSRIFDQREMVGWLKANPDAPVLRPLNYPPGVPGRATLIATTAKGPVEILNLNGRVYFNEMDSPFRVIDEWLERRTAVVPLLVDFHAEATSEKVVLGWYLDGRVSAVLGSHTRTPTGDARLLKQGTAHVSDVGMVGLHNSAAGLEVETALKPFTSHFSVRPRQYHRGSGPLVFNSVLVQIEPLSAQAVAIDRLDMLIEDES